MNEQLKFTWGHIIAFLALIFLSYVAFVGVSYMTNGDFIKAGVAVVAIDIVLFVLFIGAQKAKAATRKFKRWIIIERLLVFSSPVLFVVVMVPFAHFWTVHSRNDEIVGNFTEAINASKQMFDDYESYAHRRIESYSALLGTVIADKAENPGAFRSCGFVAEKAAVQKENFVHTLRLQLLSSNYDSLKTEANKWIEASSDGASTWNVFLLGNTREIRSAIHGWNKQLAGYAGSKLTNEETNGNRVEPFGEYNASLNTVDARLGHLERLFVTKDFPPAHACLIGVLLYFSLLFPYFLQDRHTKSRYRLVGMARGASDTSPLVAGLPSGKAGKPTSGAKPSRASDADDDYSSFTI